MPIAGVGVQVPPRAQWETFSNPLFLLPVEGRVFCFVCEVFLKVIPADSFILINLIITDLLFESYFLLKPQIYYTQKSQAFPEASSTTL